MAAAVGPGTMVVRGARGRCGRCGSRGIFRSYFELHERCPTCGYRFVREAGAFTGVMLMNITGTFVLMFVALMAYVLYRGITGQDIAIWPFAIACVASAVVMPVVFYPLASSSWAAIDLAMRPLEDDERREAAEAVRERST